MTPGRLARLAAASTRRWSPFFTLANPAPPAHNERAACSSSARSRSLVPSSQHARRGGTCAARPPDRSDSSRQLGQRVRSLRLSHIPDRRITGGTVIGWALLAAIAVGATYGIYRAWQARAGEVAGLSQPAGSAPAQSQNSNPPATASKSTRAAVSTLKPVEPEPAKGEVALESYGHIIPAHQILVSPKVSGMIVQLNVEEGRRVQKGDVIAVLESTDYEADVARAKANVKVCEEKLRELENGNRPEEIKQAEAELRESQATLVQLAAEWQAETSISACRNRSPSRNMNWPKAALRPCSSASSGSPMPWS